MKTLPNENIMRATLRAKMDGIGLTQADVCKKTGIKQSVISLFIKGKRGLSWKNVLLLYPLIHDELSSPPPDGGDGEA
jgi:transcriptional regulator with XRE-family HTH domain